METFIPLNGSAGNSAPVGGRRHKLKLVTRKVARKALKKLGLKMRGGEAGKPDDAPVALPEEVAKQAGGAAAAAPAVPATVAPAAGGRRKTRKAKKSKRRGLFY